LEGVHAGAAQAQAAGEPQDRGLQQDRQGR
jgi:hypothetical protein